VLRLASDERLVEMLRGGSEAAFEAMFDRHHRGVLGFCRHMLGSVEEAEDAVQHTFLAAYRELAGSQRPIQLRPWLYAIARNRCLTVLRARGRQSHGEIVEPPTEHLAAEVERRHDLRSLLGDVARLPDDQRAALVLSELGDMAHDQIADVLGCRREKVKALVFQARSSLIASRSAREASCADMRELVASLRGGSLRRNEVRRHLAECDGCREFREEVRRQRRQLAVVLPVAPTVGLKAAVVGGAATTGAIAAKVLVVAAIVGTGTAAVEVESHKTPQPAPSPAPAANESAVPTAATAPPVVFTASPHRHVQHRAAPPVHRTRGAARAKPAAPHHAAGPKAGAKTHASPAAAPKLSATPTVAPGQAKKPAGWVPPGQAKAQQPPAVPPGHAKKQATAEPIPPGQAKKQAEPAPPPGQAKKQQPAAVPPGQVKKQDATVPSPGQAKKQTTP
jgi:RNA polymerase sigma factor (sigma-70 family)